jgi:hypothetical protein
MSTIALAPPAPLTAALPAHADGGVPVPLRYPTAGGFPVQALATWTATRP